MKNNKGFSLVELIIVIAIMAILVGVMAPQLIKYIEKTNVSSDAQLCKSISTAMQTAATDAAVANETDYKPYAEGCKGLVSSVNPGGKVYLSSVEETLGVKSMSDLSKQVKSTLGKKNKDKINYYWVSDSSVVVYIEGSSKNGSKTTAGTTNNADNLVINAGPIEML